MYLQVVESTNTDNRVTIENLDHALDLASADATLSTPLAVNIGFKRLKLSNGDVKNRKKVGVLISGSGTNLQALIDKSLRHDSSAEIVLVVSNKAGVKGLQRAANVGIPTKVQYVLYIRVITGADLGVGPLLKICIFFKFGKTLCVVIGREIHTNIS